MSLVHLYHTVNILIGIRRLRPDGFFPLFQDIRPAFQVTACRIDGRYNMEPFHESAKLLIVPFDGVPTGFFPSGTVACTPERIRLPQSAQQVAGAAHGTGNHHRFPITGKFRALHFPTAPGAAGTFPVDIVNFAGDFLFPDIVVGSIIEQLHATDAQYIRKGILDHKTEEETVGKPEVSGISGNRPEPFPWALCRAVLWYRIDLIPRMGQSGRIDILAG